ncbi:proline-rich protein 23B [Nannospalax galili]|uniref:proline-rich protein 23B n=1 Tax=Nannospalax galili TaxID=1026970 RepID=UPI0004ED1DF0|nr:proline-rich protein 23B [Nannospalax galili]
MLGVRPRSPSAEPAPSWTPQPEAPGPAKRRRLHQPAGPEALPTPGLEAPAGPTSAALPSTSVVLLASGCALQLTLDGVDLLLQPEPTSLLQVSLQGHTVILVPEGLLSCAHPSPGRLEHAPAGLQVTAPLDTPQDHLVVMEEESWESVPDIACQEDASDWDADPGILMPRDHLVVMEEESWESVPDIACQEDAGDWDADPGILTPRNHLDFVMKEEPWESVPDIACQEDAGDWDADPGILAPWMDAPAGRAEGFPPSTGASMRWPQDRVPEPWSPVSSSSAESLDPPSIWDLDSCTLRPFPSSPLQPLPPSPPPSPQEQRPPQSPRPQSKVRRRLFHE